MLTYARRTKEGCGARFEKVLPWALTLPCPVLDYGNWRGPSASLYVFSEHRVHCGRWTGQQMFIHLEAIRVDAGVRNGAPRGHSVAWGFAGSHAEQELSLNMSRRLQREKR